MSSMAMVTGLSSLPVGGMTTTAGSCENRSDHHSGVVMHCWSGRQRLDGPSYRLDGRRRLDAVDGKWTVVTIIRLCPYLVGIEPLTYL